MKHLTTIKAQLAPITIAHVVAFDNRRCIGKDNQMAWHIPEDLAHFKAITAGGVVLMGRKTFESIKKPLPNRTNWVISRDEAYLQQLAKCHHGIKTANSLEAALLLAGADVNTDRGDDNATLFIIGGGEIYRQSLPLVDILYISRVDLLIDGDAFYPDIEGFVLTQRQDIISKNGIAVAFETYKKR